MAARHPPSAPTAASILRGVTPPTSRGDGRGVTVKPTHAVLFRSLFTSFTRCFDDRLQKLEGRLDALHDRLVGSERFTIYALKEN